MENSDQMVTLFIKEGISLNTDILETGLINNLVLVVILFYSIRNLIIPILEKRRKKIITDLIKVNQQLLATVRRLREAKYKADHRSDLILEIRRKALRNKISFLQSETLKSKKDLAVRFDLAVATLSSKERKIVIEIKEQIISLVLQRTVKRVQRNFKSKRRSSALINETINKLKGDLL